jgi:hypothetical protein
MKAQRINLPLSLTVEEVYPYLGVTTEKTSEKLIEHILHYIKIFRCGTKPTGIWKNIELYERQQDKILLKNTKLVIEGAQTASHFPACSAFTLLAVTLGPEADALLSEPKSSRLEELVCDGVASAAVENVTEQLDKLLAMGIRRQGFFPTARYSPGYGDWPLSWQGDLLQTLDAAQIGITVSPYCVLQPLKSVTALIGHSRIPVERNYATAERQKPCQGTLSCPQCPLFPGCADRQP